MFSELVLCGYPPEDLLLRPGFIAAHDRVLHELAGVLPPLGGEIERAKAVEIAYYEQNVYTALDPNVDILTTLERMAAPGITGQQIRDMAGGFLFFLADYSIVFLRVQPHLQKPFCLLINISLEYKGLRW